MDYITMDSNPNYPQNQGLNMPGIKNGKVCPKCLIGWVLILVLVMVCVRRML